MKNKDSQYICDVNYEFSLPRDPQEPKLLKYSFQPNEFTKYRPSLLEMASRSSVLLDCDWLEALEDGFLKPESFVPRGTGEHALTENDGNIISSVLPNAALLVTSNNGEKAKDNEDGSQKEVRVERSPKSPVDIIEEQFAIVNNPEDIPVHPTKPHLKPKRILHILPHMGQNHQNLMVSSIEDISADTDRAEILICENMSKHNKRFAYFKEVPVDAANETEAQGENQKVLSHQRTYTCQILEKSKDDKRLLFEIPSADTDNEFSYKKNDTVYVSLLKGQKLILKKMSSAMIGKASSKHGLLVAEYVKPKKEEEKKIEETEADDEDEADGLPEEEEELEDSGDDEDASSGASGSENASGSGEGESDEEMEDEEAK